MVGPNDDQTRIAVAFIEPTQESYKMQSMIIDLSPVKNGKEQPSFLQIDLTSTVRSLSTGEKKQKILLLRLKKPGELELKCDGNWVRQDASPAIDNIIEVTKAIIRGVPVDTKTPTEATLSQEVEQRITSILTFPRHGKLSVSGKC